LVLLCGSGTIGVRSQAAESGTAADLAVETGSLVKGLAGAVGESAAKEPKRGGEGAPACEGADEAPTVFFLRLMRHEYPREFLSCDPHKEVVFIVPHEHIVAGVIFLDELCFFDERFDFR